MKIWIHASEKLSAFDNLVQLPTELVGAVMLLSYWITKEKCGFTHTLQEAEQFIMERTVDNPKSKWYHCKEGATAMIEDLFNNLEDMGISVSDLVKMGRYGESFNRSVFEKSTNTNPLSSARQTYNLTV